MKWRNKKYLLGFSFVIVMGVLAGKSLIPYPSQVTPELSDSIDYLIVAPDIRVYTKESAAIVIGEVKEVVDRPNNTGTPFTRSILDAKIDVSEVLKGDPKMSTVTVMMIGGQLENGDNVEDGVILKSGERVILFLGIDNSNNYVVFAGSAGKGLIDKNNNVTGYPVFTMPLAELKAKIQDALIQLKSN